MKTEKSKLTLPILITANKNTQPLLGLDLLNKLEIGLQGNKNTSNIRHIETDERRQKIVDEYNDLVTKRWIHQVTKRWIQSECEENRIIQTRDNLAGQPHQSKWGKAIERQDKSDNKTESPKER